MNIEELSIPIKQDIEDQSLEILEKIASNIIVIGGWAVRAHLGEEHHRYTLDVDGVTDERTLQNLRKLFESSEFEERPVEWGVKFFKRYIPRIETDDDIESRVELRIELSHPRIKERNTHHYFEFSLTDFEEIYIPYHNIDKQVKVRVPPLEHMTAVKLGMPVDYKHNHDAAMLLRNSDIDKVIQVIKSNDDWQDIVLRRMPKLKGRITQPGRIENTLAIASGLDIRKHIGLLEKIENDLM